MYETVYYTWNVQRRTWPEKGTRTILQLERRDEHGGALFCTKKEWRMNKNHVFISEIISDEPRLVQPEARSGAFDICVQSFPPTLALERVNAFRRHSNIHWEQSHFFGAIWTVLCQTIMTRNTILVLPEGHGRSWFMFKGKRRRANPSTHMARRTYAAHTPAAVRKSDWSFDPVPLN